MSCKYGFSKKQYTLIEYKKLIFYFIKSKYHNSTSTKYTIQIQYKYNMSGHITTPNSNDESIVTIVTKDGKQYKVKSRYLQNCGTLKTLISDIDYNDNHDIDGDENSIPISVDSKEWEICYDYLAQVDVNYSKEFVRISCPDWLYSESVFDDSGREIHKKHSYKKMDAEYLRKFPVNGDELTWRDTHFKGYNTLDLTGDEKEDRVRLQRQMIQVLLAANYLDIEGLIILICRSIGHEINTHDVVKIRELFDGNHNMMGFENDFTEEEINEIEKENDFMKFLSTEAEEDF